MKKVRRHFGMLAVLVSCAAAQNTGTATVRSVTATREGAEVLVRITLTASVKPSAEAAVHPDRILLDFPETTSNADIQNVGVHVNGVVRVRTGQHSRIPLITRVVVDLDQARSYMVKMDENVVTLTIGSPDKVHSSRGAPAAATSGNLIGIFRRKQERTTPISTNESTNDLPSTPPPIAAGPAFEPPKDSSAGAPPSERPMAPVPRSASAPVSQSSAGQASFGQDQIAAASAPKPASTAPNIGAGTSNVSAPVSTVSAPPSTNSEVSVAARVPAAAWGPVTAEAATPIIRTDDPSLRTVFKVKYVAEGVAYLEGGHAQGLAEGMKLEVEETNLLARQGDSASAADPRVVAELEVTAVAETSAVTDIHVPKRPVKPGDLAYLSTGDTEALVQQRTLSATRQYPAVISFTEGDTLDEEVREVVPRPPLPSVNRARGRIGFDDIETISHGTSNITSSDFGMSFRGDITRIGGTYWNLSGYWRGSLNKTSAASQQTLQNLINRTYHLNMTYDNPNSSLVAGFGRLYLPWAPSLDTIDGGYFGGRLSKGTTLGVFAGSTPDPSSWDYSPDRVIGGTFINFEGGEYNGFHYSSTAGAGVSMVKWAMNTPFLFFEDVVSYKHDIAIYESAQLNNPKGNSVTPAPGPGLGRNFFTLRVNPHPRIELDLNYNYFREIPTFSPTLIGTGLLDKYLFQGFSGGGRVEVANQIWVSANLGRSTGTGDAKTSLNEMYGVTFGRLPVLKLRADVHYARFNGSFGAGSYEAISISRQMSDRLRLEVLLGQQHFASMLTTNTRGRFVTGTVETGLGPHFYLLGNFTTNRGDLSYDQIMFSVGYRFDSKRRHE